MSSPRALFSCIDRNDAFSVSNVLTVFFSLELGADGTPLFVCVLRYHVAAAQLLLASPLCDPDALCTRQQISALHIAVAEGRLEFISALLRFGASPNVLSPDFGTPLHVAAARNHCNCARLLIDAAADVNACTADTGETALMLAARKGHLEFVRLLLGNGKIEPYAKDRIVGHTALHEAALNGHSAVVRALLERFPQLASVRSTLTRETASFASSFRVQAVMADGYAGQSRGFVRNDIGSDVTLVAEANAGRADGGLACHRVILHARCPALAHAHVAAGEPSVWAVPASLCAAKALPLLVEFLYSDAVSKLSERGDAVLAQLSRAANALHLPRLEHLSVAASEVGARSRTAPPPSTLAVDMERALASGARFADVQLATANADSVPLPAHKFVLCQHSFFRALLAGGMREAQQDVVRLSLSGETAELALRLLLRFLYTHELELTADDSHVVIELFEIANSLLIGDLVRRIEALLVADLLDDDNVAQLFVLADTFQSLYLREECFDFMVEHWDELDEAARAALPAGARAELDRARAFRAEQRNRGLSSESLRSAVSQMRLELRQKKRDKSGDD